MSQIAQIEALDLTKIINKEIKNEIQKLTEEYNTAEDKKDFIEATKESATLILEMVQDVYPEAIAEKEKPCVEVVVSPKKVTKPKKKKKTAVKKPEAQKKAIKKKPATPTLSKLEALQKEVEECRKRGAIRKIPKNKTPTIPKTVYDKVYSHINAIANLLPERFRHDTEKVEDLKRLSLNTHKKVVVVFELNQTLAEKGKVTLKQKFKDITKRIEANDNK